jgi:hypothetical protein
MVLSRLLAGDALLYSRRSDSSYTLQWLIAGKMGKMEMGFELDTVDSQIGT